MRRCCWSGWSTCTSRNGSARRSNRDRRHSAISTVSCSAVNASLAAQSAVVALESLGLGAVYIGGMRNRPADVAQELGMPGHVVALFGLVVGWPDPARPASVKPRLPQPAVLFREQYDEAAQGSQIALYDERLRGFQEEQGLPEIGWSATVANRLAGATALNGREQLRATLNMLGFGLE